MPEDRSLEAVAGKFASELADTVSRFLGRDCNFTSSALPNGRFSVEDEDDAGIPLTIAGTPLLVLSAEILCYWDSREAYLAVEKSTFAVFAGDQSREPLFRYEYRREPTNKNVPCAHLQIGAHRDEFTHALAYGGISSRRSRKRAENRPGRPPRIAEVHFPLGGPRFRPCLEDVLAMIREEFGIDTAADWAAVVNKGRRQWRLVQIAAAVRDCPEEAARVLRELHYTVERTDLVTASENADRLIQA
jgi:hypothetical protein